MVINLSFGFYFLTNPYGSFFKPLTPEPQNEQKIYYVKSCKDFCWVCLSNICILIILCTVWILRSWFILSHTPVLHFIPLPDVILAHFYTFCIKYKEFIFSSLALWFLTTSSVHQGDPEFQTYLSRTRPPKSFDLLTFSMNYLVLYIIICSCIISSSQLQLKFMRFKSAGYFTNSWMRISYRKNQKPQGLRVVLLFIPPLVKVKISLKGPVLV